MAAIHRAGTAGFDRHAIALAWTLATYFDRRGHWHDWATAQSAALAAARRLGDRPALAEALRLAGNAYSNLRRYDDAHAALTEALALFASLHRDAGTAHTEFDLAMLLDRWGRPREALHHAHRSLALYRRSGGGLVKQAVALNAIGWYHAQLGEYRPAITHCRQALGLAEEAGSLYGQANTWDSLGFAHHHLGERAAAVDCYRAALTLFRRMGDRHAEAIVLDHLGDTYRADDRADEAYSVWHEAADMFEVLGHADADRVRAKLTPSHRPVRRG